MNGEHVAPGPSFARWVSRGVTNSPLVPPRAECGPTEEVLETFDAALPGRFALPVVVLLELVTPDTSDVGTSRDALSS